MVEFRFLHLKEGRFSNWYVGDTCFCYLWPSLKFNNLWWDLRFLPLELKDKTLSYLKRSMWSCHSSTVTEATLCLITVPHCSGREGALAQSTGCLDPIRRDHSLFQRDSWPPQDPSDSFLMRRPSFLESGFLLFTPWWWQGEGVLIVFCHVVKMAIPHDM